MAEKHSDASSDDVQPRLLLLQYPTNAETTRISANGTPNLSTSVVVPGGLPRANPVSAMPKSIQKDKNSKVEYNIYFITLIRVHLFGTCRVQVHRD
jgi:hypothetical protein